jgi:predicted ester cyclase
MIAEDNVSVMRRVVDEIWNLGASEVADRFFAPDYVNHGGLIPDLVRGPEAIKVSVALYRRAFPHLRVDVEDLVADGDIVVVRWTASDKRPEASPDVAPAGGPGTLSGTTRTRLAGGKIVESWTDWEATGALRRLGLI